MSDKFMKIAVGEALSGIRCHHGGPFGSVIVRDGRVVGRGHNCVLLKHDPTCHGEIEAIHNACAELGTHDLSGCELYTTAEPCPMCLGAIMWANIDRVYYGCNRHDTEDIGFRDNKFYEYLGGGDGLLGMSELDRAECLEVFAEYSSDPANRIY